MNGYTCRDISRLSTIWSHGARKLDTHKAKAAGIAHTAHVDKTGLLVAALKLGYLTKEQFH